MAVKYSVDVCRKLEQNFYQQSIHRPMRISRYEPGTEISYDVTTLQESKKATVTLLIEKFIGGGYAGQVYKVKVTDIQAEKPINEIQIGNFYAIKILIPPSAFAKFFRNMLYLIGFQGPFQLQSNPAAARAGALWQKFIRQAAKIQFGNENTVVNIHATFIDKTLGSCGELSEWIEGRTWQLEVDENMDTLNIWKKGRKVDPQKLGSPEYRSKRKFMAEFVKLLHKIGAHEFARQYEWSTCKSQPNCLKRIDSENIPSSDLVAVDFRAGLTLLPFLPMSPGDFMLILKGIARGSIVQFDRGDLKKLKAFIHENPEQFEDSKQMLDELMTNEQIYRNSIPDITHNHIQLLYSTKLWSTIFNSRVTGWKVRNLIDLEHEQKFRKCKSSYFLFFILGIIPIFGKIIRRIWALPPWRKHYTKILTSLDYFKRAFKARISEKAINWYRSGRINENTAAKLNDSPILFLTHFSLSLLPVCLHRFFTDIQYAKQSLAYLIIRPIKLYFNSNLREQWLRDMVADGQKKRILTQDDANVILSRIKEPFIQKYLKALAVHICTLPVTQIVSVIIAVTYVLMHPEMPRKQSWAIGLGIIGLFQVIPISPGSFCRGAYVVYLVIKERNFKDYNIALFLSFFKYIGYLAFPIQMTYHYPALARFMATHWATEAVHIVPVFGETGALLEHWVFCLFYNWPLTIRRRMHKIAQIRQSLNPRYYHVFLYAVTAAILLGLCHAWIPDSMWIIKVIIPLIGGSLVTFGCKGANLTKRFLAAITFGTITAVLYAALLAYVKTSLQTNTFTIDLIWHLFIFTVFSTIGAVLTELSLPDQDLT